MVPKFLNRRFAIVTGLAILGAVAFAPKASAQVSEIVPMNGDVFAECTFGTVTDGVLDLTAPTTFGTATDGTVLLSCNNPATIEVAAPALGAVPGGVVIGNFTTLTSSATIGAVTVNNGDAAAAITVGTPFTDETISVSMDAVYNAALPVGAYTFNVQVTTSAN